MFWTMLLCTGPSILRLPDHYSPYFGDWRNILLDSNDSKIIGLERMECSNYVKVCKPVRMHPRNYRNIVKRLLTLLQHSCQDSYSTFVKTPAALLSRLLEESIAKMIEYFSLNSPVYHSNSTWDYHSLHLLPPKNVWIKYKWINYGGSPRSFKARRKATKAHWVHSH